jgi:metal-responsive CopG/Arc/MetJ family transcriptional regulator
MARVAISIPDALLERVDAAAASRDLSRDAFLCIALEREVRRDEQMVAIARARAAMVAAPRPDPAAVIRADRDSH